MCCLLFSNYFIAFTLAVCSKNFTNINPFDHLDNPMRSVLLLPRFRNEKTKSQKGLSNEPKIVQSVVCRVAAIPI